MNVEGKVIVITGASSGIGRATAQKFAKEGAKVIVSDANEAEGKETVKIIKSEAGDVAFIKTDVTKLEDVEKAVDFAVETYGRIDIMFNNAGIADSGTPIFEQSPDVFEKVVKVNQFGVYHGILAAARKMRDLKIKGVIVNTASAYGFLASENAFSYCTTKAAVKMMTQSAALELASYNIRVVGVAPGYVKTPIITGLEEKEERLSKKHMRNVIIRPEEIANAVYLLCLDEANVINGSTLFLDDGYVQFK